MCIKKIVLFSLTIILLILPLITGCNISNSQEKISNPSEDKIYVYTTLYILEEFSQRIGGENVVVINLVPPGVSPHDYEPSAKDITNLAQGDVFIYNGGGLELWVNKAIENLKETNVEIVNASQNINLINKNDEHQSDAQTDPHVWLNPLFALEQAESIKDTYIKLDSKNEFFYEENYQDLKEELLALDSKFEESLKNVEKKDFFVSHAAFGYLAERYGLEQHSISGFSPEDEPSAAELSKLINEIRNLNIKYILTDPTESTKISQVLADEIDVKTENIYTISSLSEDEIALGLNYIKMMEKNLNVLLISLSE
ncbi:MAG: metal ABC transporter substrate-binding protein [Vulcanibacillus sp.]